MTPPNLHDDHDFREFVVENLTEVRTKMELLISNGGSKGLVPELRKDVDDHEKQINRWKGALGVLTFLLLLLGGTEIWHIATLAKGAVK
jgi:hypothetical protein